MGSSSLLRGRRSVWRNALPIYGRRFSGISVEVVNSTACPGDSPTPNANPRLAVDKSASVNFRNSAVGKPIPNQTGPSSRPHSFLTCDRKAVWADSSRHLARSDRDTFVLFSNQRTWPCFSARMSGMKALAFLFPAVFSRKARPVPLCGKSHARICQPSVSKKFQQRQRDLLFGHGA